KRIGRFERNTKRHLSRTTKHFAGLTSGVRLTLRAVAALSAGGLVARVVSDLDRIGKQADKLGLTTDALQEMRFAADQSGIAVNTFDMAYQRFIRRLAEARQGKGEARDALKELGIALVDAEGNARSSEAVLREVADGMVQLEDQSDRVRVAMRLFDSEGVAMVNMLRNGSAGLDEMRQRARDLGIVIREETVREAEELKNKLGEVTGQLKAELSEALINIGPLLVGVAGFMADVAGAAGALGAAAAAAAAELRGVIEAAVGVGNVQLPSQLSPEEAARLQADVEAAGNLGGGDPSNTGRVFVDDKGNIVEYGTPAAERVIAGITGPASRQIVPAHGDRFLSPTDPRSPYMMSERGRAAYRARLYSSGASKRSRGGGGGASREMDRMNDLMREGEALQERLRTETERYNDEMARHRELLDAGTIGQETYARAVEDTESRLGRFGALSRDLKDALIDAAAGGANAFRNLGEAIKRAAAEYALFGSGPLSGILGGGFKGLLGGFSLFDRGGYTGNAPTGRATGIVHGQEYVMDAASTRRIGVQTLDAMRRGMMPAVPVSGGAQRLDGSIRVYVDQDGEWQAEVRRISVSATAPIIGQFAQAQQESFGAALNNYQSRGTAT
ncbi:MAG: hypothetical protein QNJ44_22520, partial [Rhodobacter sp.]|nr:hypothetical protein [Rhodobacter sp.]